VRLTPGEIVISNPNSDETIGSGNVAPANLKVLGRSPDTVWLVQTSDTEVSCHHVSSEIMFFTKWRLPGKAVMKG